MKYLAESNCFYFTVKLKNMFNEQRAPNSKLPNLEITPGPIGSILKKPWGKSLTPQRFFLIRGIALLFFAPFTREKCPKIHKIETWPKFGSKMMNSWNQCPRERPYLGNFELQKWP